MKSLKYLADSPAVSVALVDYDSWLNFVIASIYHSAIFRHLSWSPAMLRSFWTSDNKTSLQTVLGFPNNFAPLFDRTASTLVICYETSCKHDVKTVLESLGLPGMKCSCLMPKSYSSTTPVVMLKRDLSG